jgi:hypothetical protein
MVSYVGCIASKDKHPITVVQDTTLNCCRKGSCQKLEYVETFTWGGRVVEGSRVSSERGNAQVRLEFT